MINQNNLNFDQVDIIDAKITDMWNDIVKNQLSID